MLYNKKWRRWDEASADSSLLRAIFLVAFDGGMKNKDTSGITGFVSGSTAT